MQVPFSNNRYKKGRAKLWKFLVECYDDYIWNVLNNIGYTERLKRNNIDTRSFDLYLKQLKKKDWNIVKIDIESVDYIIVQALEIGNKIDKMNKKEQTVFWLVLDAYFYNSEKKKWIL
jgi:hypothetical protein